jgi:ParB family transcriptional regulator, chromosome partitioning protein
MSKPPDNPRKALGKGLSALLPPRPVPVPQAAETPSLESAVTHLPVDRIEPNPLQPRSVFQADRLQELADSIKANGIIQPLVVRRRGDSFQLVAGERRWRAAKVAGLEEVPVVVQEIPDERLLEITLIENIQREDLNPIEIAQAFDRLARELKLNHEEIGKRTGKDRATITNMLRLLRLPQPIQQLLIDRRLSMGHARAILGLAGEDIQLQVAEKASAQGLSVRQVEHLIQRMTKTRETQAPDEVRQDPNVRAAVEELERVLGTRVRIVEKSEKRGRIEIEYYSPDELDRLYSQIVGKEN